MSFKFLRGKDELTFRLEPMQQLTLTRPIVNQENVEFCFQFGDNEPVVFANGPNVCSIHLSPQIDTNMTFTDNDMEFKLFARERQDG
jgi:hypothetical protein